MHRHQFGVADHLAFSHRDDHTTIDHWPMGHGTHLLALRYREIAASVTRDRSADPSTRLITVAVLTPGAWSLTRDRYRIAPLPDRPTLVVLDQFRPFDFRGPGTGAAIAVSTHHARLALSIETIDRAMANLHPGLPLYPLARNHLQQLGVVAARSPTVLPELNSTTIALVRSLLLSAAESGIPRGSTENLVTAIKRYIDENLDTAELRAETIAAAHHISARQLYNIWPKTNGTLTTYITAQRLERARASLLTHRHLTVAAIARRHGFTNPTHFTHRFRDAYGTTPSSWRLNAQPSLERNNG